MTSIKEIINNVLFICGIIVVVFLYLLTNAEVLFPSWCGCHSLGDDFYALDWEKRNQIVVYCPKNELYGNTAYDGIPLVDTGEYDLVSIKYNNNYIAIIAHNKNFDYQTYCIFDKRSIKTIPKDSINMNFIERHMYICANENEFNTFCKLKNVILAP